MALFGPKTIGLALGSGSARGYAHIGVLRVLEAEDLRPDVVTGTSMGAVIGAFYAAGHTPDEIERLAIEYDVRSLFRLSEVSFGHGGLLSGERLERLLREYLPATFEELELPFGCVATDMTRNEAVYFSSGDLITAVRASASVPVVFAPVRLDDRLLVDGDVIDPVPVTFARRLGAQVVVAVEVCGTGTVAAEEGNGHSKGVLRDLRAAVRGDQAFKRGSTGPEIMAAVYEAFECQIAAPSLRKADLVISPKVRDTASFDFLQASAVIAAGVEAARDVIEELRRKSRRRALSHAGG